MGRVISVLVIIFASAMLIINFYRQQAPEDVQKDSETNGNLEVHMEDAQFVQVKNGPSYNPEKEEGILKVELKIKNNTSNTLQVRPESDIVLYDGDKQIDALQNVSDPFLNREVYSSSSLIAGKQKSFIVLFAVTFDTAYEMHISPKANYGNEEVDDVTIPLDVRDYMDTYEQINEPVEALQAYVDAVYFQEDIDVEEKMDVHIETLQAEAKSDFLSFITFRRSEKLPDKIADRFYDTYINTLKKEGEVNGTIIAYNENNASVQLEYRLPSYSKLLTDMSEVRLTAREEKNISELKNADEATWKEIDELIEGVQMESGQIEVYLMKKDGKWEFHPNYSDGEKQIKRIFGKGY